MQSLKTDQGWKSERAGWSPMSKEVPSWGRSESQWQPEGVGHAVRTLAVGWRELARLG